MIKKIFLILVIALPATASLRKISAVVFSKPVTLDDKTLEAIRGQIDRSKFTAETFSGTIHCNTYKKNGTGLECLLVSVKPEELKSQKK